MTHPSVCCRSPFVLGVPAMIEILVKDIPEAEKGFVLFFSESPFPRYQSELTWLREESGGNWYRETRTGLEGWLCPALFRYFREAPRRIHCGAASKDTPRIG